MDAAYVYRASTERVIDGDTYVLRVDLGFRVEISVTGRLRGIDCPEMKTERGKEVRGIVEKILIPENDIAVPLIMQSYKDKMSFARWIVDLWLPNGDNLSEQLLSQGLGTVMIR